MTKELERISDPSAVATMRKLLEQFISNLLDSSMVDSVAEVTGVRPAGLLNGVTPIVGTARGGYNALQKDLQAVVDAFAAAGVGVKPALLVNANKTFGLRAMQNALGQFVSPMVRVRRSASRWWPRSSSLHAQPSWSMLPARQVPSMTLEFDLYEQATLTMANARRGGPDAGRCDSWRWCSRLATRAGSGWWHPCGGRRRPSTTGYVAMSLWQTWSLGIRLVMPAAFGVTRAGAVRQLTTITW